MSDNSAIEWTDTTWNPVRGCSRVSEGCRNCYAETMAARFSDPGMWGHGFADRDRSGSKWTGKVELIPEKLTEPLRWKKPRRVFVNSMSDLFHEELSFEDIDRVFRVMQQAKEHTFQVLTKRPERALEFLTKHVSVPWGGFQWGVDTGRNVHIGVSVENQQAADERIPLLLQIPAAVRFLSVEPLLGPVDLNGVWGYPGSADSEQLDSWPIQWVIVGGESGHNARPCNAGWIRSIVHQCQIARVPVFVKQLGSNVVTRNDDGFDGVSPIAWPEHIDYENRVEELTTEHWQGDPVRINLRSRKGGNPEEWPADLRVREFPEVKS